VDTRLEIRDTEEGLIVSATASNATLLWRIPVEVAIGAVFIVYWYRSTVPNFLFFVVSGILALGILKDLVSLLRGTSVELVITNSGFISSGHSPGGYYRCSVARADVRNLEYRKAAGGGDIPESPAGLFVETHDASWLSPGMCVLPHLNEEQTNQVIEAVLRRFPDLPSGAPEPSGLISLNLNKPRAGLR